MVCAHAVTGPCRVHDVNNVTFNPFSWNENANIFFIDQPIGVGFSYADHGEYVVSQLRRCRVHVLRTLICPWL